MSEYLHLWYSFFDVLKPMFVVKLEFQNVHILKACRFGMRYMHHWSLNLSTMSTLVTELAECCAQVTKLGKDEQTGHNRDVAR